MAQHTIHFVFTGICSYSNSYKYRFISNFGYKPAAKACLTFVYIHHSHQLYWLEHISKLPSSSSFIYAFLFNLPPFIPRRIYSLCVCVCREWFCIGCLKPKRDVGQRTEDAIYFGCAGFFYICDIAHSCGLYGDGNGANSWPRIEHVPAAVIRREAAKGFSTPICLFDLFHCSAFHRKKTQSYGISANTSN